MIIINFKHYGIMKVNLVVLNSENKQWMTIVKAKYYWNTINLQRVWGKMNWQMFYIA